MGSAAAAAASIGRTAGSAEADVLFFHENLFELILIMHVIISDASIDRIDGVVNS